MATNPRIQAWRRRDKPPVSAFSSLARMRIRPFRTFDYEFPLLQEITKPLSTHRSVLPSQHGPLSRPSCPHTRASRWWWPRRTGFLTLDVLRNPLIRLTQSSKATISGPLQPDVLQARAYRLCHVTAPWHLTPLPSLYCGSSMCLRKSPPEAGVFLMWDSEHGTTLNWFPRVVCGR